MGASDNVADAIMKLVASDQAQPHAGRPGKPVMLPDASIAFAAVTLMALNAATTADPTTGAAGCQCGSGSLTQNLVRVPLIDSSNTRSHPRT
jgi:fructose-specific component phosphotransferase system IIB-like protein